MKFYNQTLSEIYKHLNSCENGLTTEQAQQVLGKNGPNKLDEAEKVTLVQRFIEQLKDPMIIILLIAAAVSAATAFYSGESFTDVFIILAVVILNAVMGVYQESKAEKAIEALSKMTAATSKVIRDGKQTVVESTQLAVGDVIVLEAGDAVPADARIIECASIKAEEAALTGESVPVSKTDEVLVAEEGKDIPLGDRKNMVYMGSTIAYGRGKAIITGTGMNTEMGKIADALIQTKDGQTPLQKKLAQLSKVLSVVVLGICAFIFAFTLIRNGNFEGRVMLETFMVAVSLAVAAIPEGLATVVTLVLSIGVTNMSKRNAVIRQLTAVETLGCAQIICSDKTGTLTQNKMTVTDHIGETELLSTAMALCNDAHLENSEAVGEATEAALVNFAFKNNINKTVLDEKYPRVAEAPFDSSRKMMSTVHNMEGIITQYTKGAPDEILKRCTHYTENGEVKPFTEEKRAEILSLNKSFADQALRVLAAAYKTYTAVPENQSAENLEKDMIFIGLTGMIDPVRPEVVDAIKECRAAGIRPVMITGDHKDTAVAIAKQLGIITDASQALSGSQLDELDEKFYFENIENYSVYARVQPQHKTKIVKTFKEKGYVCAMTGDGVNDAPSIKTSDIGIAMGITGTDVTKNVADMVLADDNFATIVGAVEEGRRIYDNIRKSIQFLLASNMSEVVGIFTATLMGFVLLKPVHLLWINLITDTLPALALGMEEAEGDVMARPPRPSNSGIFAEGLGIDVIYQGIMVAVLTLVAYFTGHYIESGVWEIANSPDGMTMAFLTMSMAEIFHSYNMRSRRVSLFKMPKQNKYLLGSMLVSLVLTTAVLYVPFLSNAFGFEHISLAEYAISMALAFSVIPIVETVKFFQRKSGRSAV
ncbi:MAG: cation-translocating P-type ATPase [Oscillospiraceae bacterium]|nr:cation-translocating P-type ATPase [Oscillospiraceae bacterium]